MLPVAPFERILRRAGAERVSRAAAGELAVYIENLGLKVAERAVDLATHAGRITVKEEDILLALE